MRLYSNYYRAATTLYNTITITITITNTSAEIVAQRLRSCKMGIADCQWVRLVVVFAVQNVIG